MEAILDAAFALAAGGFRRGRREPRPVVKVAPTGWLTAGIAAVLAHTLLVVGATGAFVVIALRMASDDLLFVLGLIMLPLALGGFLAGIGVVAWLIGVIRTLLAADAAARIDLLAVGVLNVLLVAPIAMLVPQVLAVTVLGVLCIFVAAVPAAWRPVDE